MTHPTIRLNGYGVPQGSTLGLLLSLLYVNDFPNAVQSVPRLFADDTCLLFRHSNPIILQEKLNQEMSFLCNWYNSSKLKRRARDQHGLDLKPTLAILLCPWERHFTAHSPAWWSW